VFSLLYEVDQVVFEQFAHVNPLRGMGTTHVNLFGEIGHRKKFIHVFGSINWSYDVQILRLRHQGQAFRVYA